MSTAAAVVAAVDVDPYAAFARPAFQADVALLADAVQEDWQRWAAQAIVLDRLAAQVPGHGVEYKHQGTPWKSFVREIAVARRCSDEGAAKEIYLSVALVQSHPRTLALLAAGRLPLYHARVLLEEGIGCAPEVVAALDAELADRACQLTPTRIRAEVRKIELRLDADGAAARSAKAATARNIRLHAGKDDQGTLVMTGPALPLVQFVEAVNAAARAARAAGDQRGLDALRFDIAVDVPHASGSAPTEPAPTEPEPAPTEPAPTEPAPAEPAEPEPTEPVPAESEPAPAEPAPTGPAPAEPALLPGWLGDRRRLRPLQVLLHLPVTTALGLDNEPGWLPGYGWVSAPQCRQWLTIAELRQVCVGADGFILDSADRVVRPTPTPVGVRDAVLQMVRDPGQITDKTYRDEPRHDPSPALAGFVDLRDQYCDGPTGARVPASRCDRDHDLPYPQGPTAAWNLKDRARRTHLLKHDGWVPLRTTTSTIWFSPAGQAIEVPHHTGPPPELDEYAEPPDPDELHDLEAELLRPLGPDDDPPSDLPPF